MSGPRPERTGVPPPSSPASVAALVAICCGKNALKSSMLRSHTAQQKCAESQISQSVAFAACVLRLHLRQKAGSLDARCSKRLRFTTGGRGFISMGTRKLLISSITVAEQPYFAYPERRRTEAAPVDR
uniref:Uncharacterized protein n=1 Tax=Molossus molossus TaxID=27622 RepID=A0A7J8BJM7_MOLMO|nr:hypothetical protein HJG59_010188 [Molossus molossus]